MWSALALDEDVPREMDHHSSGCLPVEKFPTEAVSQELASAFQHHLEETRGHVSRLESIFNQIGEKYSGVTCEAINGLIKEG